MMGTQDGGQLDTSSRVGLATPKSFSRSNPMRAILLILIIAVVALIAAVATGLIDIRQTSPAVAPTVETSDGALTTQPGQAPTFDIETGSIGVAANGAT